MNDNKNKILIIEDDPDIVNLTRIHINDLGYDLDWADNGHKGLREALENDYALVILDLMLPGMDGFEICKRIRQEDQFLPLLMLTAKSEELDKVLGLELGADDYLTKPFSVRELVARIKAILRRFEKEKELDHKDIEQEILQFDDLIIDTGKRRVTKGDQKIDLTAKEFDLLVLFAKNPGKTYNRGQLLDLIWGYHFDGYDHTVNSHINRLRGKIEGNPSQPRFIRTVWGVGYRFADPEELTG